MDRLSTALSKRMPCQRQADCPVRLWFCAVGHSRRNESHLLRAALSDASGITIPEADIGRRRPSGHRRPPCPTSCCFPPCS
ncbi:Transcriptional regulator, TetR family (fragment) [Pseudomonas sp. 8O]